MKPDTPTTNPPICDYEESDYQSKFWDEGTRAYEDQCEEIALKRLLPSSGKLLLEAGAGAGRNTPRYQGFEHVVLLDYSMSQLRLAQQSLGTSRMYTYVAADVYRLPFLHGLFDSATMIRTIHHMQDAPLALQQMRSVLKTGAVFILEFANKKNIKAIARYALGRQTWNPFSPEPVEFVELNFDFHPKTMRSWLQENDFEIERQLTVSHYRVGLLKRFLPTRLLVRMDSIAQLTGDWWQLTPSVFVRSRAIGATPPPPPGNFFRCLKCGSEDMQENTEYVECPLCASKWAIVDGIFDFREPIIE